MKPAVPGPIEKLRTLTSPTIANALQSLNIPCQNSDSAQIICRLPNLGAMVGYAATAIVRTEPIGGRRPAEEEWWNYINQISAPRVVAFENVDMPRTHCATWGGVQSNIHRALGCCGLITNGIACDLENADAIRFHLFTAGIAAVHGYLQFVSLGNSVNIGGLFIRPNDLIHADQYGAIVIPEDTIDVLLRRIAESEMREQAMIRICQQDGVTLEQIKAARKSMTV